jgi:group II intron reverse transcriptase/maturase
MQSAETVLGVIRERGRADLPLERLYRQLFNPQLFLLAYGRIYSNQGSMTPGATAETVDGMSLAKIGGIIGALRSESYRWHAARRVWIPKKNGKRRPLGLPTWSDKLVAEVVRLLLEAYYDVRFSDRSHGFRRGRGCHTALSEVAAGWTGTHWFIEGDISDCFGSFDHEVMVSTLAERIHDGRFLQLIKRMLQAGYLEDWIWNATLSGCPQGGTASPILSNIYLDRLDQFVEDELLPQYNRGEIRRKNPDYLAVKSQIEKAERRGDRPAVRVLKQQRRTLPSGDPNDPGFRRLKYVRYCDDFLLGFAGPRHEAEQIKARIGRFLHDELNLELSESKTAITHAASQAARFLGYEIRTQHNDTKVTGGRRAVNGVVGLFVPQSAIRERCRRYMKNGKPAKRGQMLHDEDFTIVEKYGAEYRGIVQYYLLAQDVARLNGLHWVMETSMLKTLAAKHSSTVSTMARKYKKVIDTPDGPRTCFQATVPREGKRPLVARFGGIPLRRKRTATLADRQPTMATRHNELIHRLLAGKCELCEATDGLQVHHLRKLADLNKPGRPERPPWVVLMATRRRKTLVVCSACHHDIHNGRASTSTRN